MSNVSPMEKWENTLSNVNHVIAVTSGKGGVGKSVTTSLIATHLNKRGYKVGILDCDLTGPSIAEIFGIDEKVYGTDEEIFPSKSPEGIKVVSINLMLPRKTDPVIWRGPILSNILKDFWEKVNWGNLDFLLLDLPPGTGDVPLTIYQHYPVDAVIVVSTPSRMASLAVKKAYEMAIRLNQNVIGEIENMSYYVCKTCGNKEYLFGQKEPIENLKEIEHIPFDSELGEKIDSGSIEDIYVMEYDKIVDFLKEKFNK
ncbi:MAG: Mrp/NBP35 family ATP-binding protein [Ezakiella sp.]|nr:Mrp/NBP35 family ATP-binding protein [Ezakiella sp.]MDD7471598.1 P-loop NTPase [Bacillota bacterium]MDY3923631.1 P-loop NTPase [Ezakiella sp.]